MFRLLLGQSLRLYMRSTILTILLEHTEFARVMHRTDEGEWDYLE